VSDEILREFGRFRRRHLWVRGLDLFLEAAFVMTITAAAMLLIDRLAFELGFAAPHLSHRAMVATTLLLPLGLSAALAIGTLLLRPTPPARIAWQLDRAAGGEERFLSALECAASGDGGPFAPALCRDAVRVARGTEPARVLPPAPVSYRWAIALSLAVGGILWAWPPQLYDAPLADLDAYPARGPAPLEVLFQDASIGAIDEFRWDYGDGRTGSGEQVTHVYEHPGSYVAKLILVGPGGTSEKTVAIEVLPPDRAAAEFRGAPLKGRGSVEVAFENLSKNGKRFTWDFGDGKTSLEFSPTHLYARPGLYSVRLTVENDLGKDEKIRDKYVKVAHPDEPVAEFRAMPREGEAPLKVEFEDMSSGVLTEWSWDFGDVRSGTERVSNERNPTHVYKNPGHYTVRLRVKGPQGEDVEEKVRYILVKSGGDGGGGGGGGSKNQDQQQKDKKSTGAGSKIGRLFGDPTDRPKVTLMPEEIRSHQKPDKGLVEKELIYTDKSKPKGEGTPSQVPLQDVLPQFQRAAEDAIERELIPPAYRDHVRRYYDDLQRK
jgi:PKD repeat protein